MKTPNGHNMQVFHGPVLDHQLHVPSRLQPIPRLGTQLTWKVNCGRVHGAQAEAENPENRTCLVFPRAELTKKNMEVWQAQSWVKFSKCWLKRPKIGLNHHFQSLKRTIMTSNTKMTPYHAPKQRSVSAIAWSIPRLPRFAQPGQNKLRIHQSFHKLIRS